MIANINYSQTFYQHSYPFIQKEELANGSTKGRQSVNFKSEVKEYHSNNEEEIVDRSSEAETVESYNEDFKTIVQIKRISKIFKKYEEIEDMKLKVDTNQSFTININRATLSIKRLKESIEDEWQKNCRKFEFSGDNRVKEQSVKRTVKGLIHYYQVMAKRHNRHSH